MNDNGTVLVDRPHGAIAVVSLNRPHRLNAVTFEVVDALRDAIGELDADPSCRVIVLTGAGRGFCSGIDLKGDGAADGGTAATPPVEPDPRSEVDRWMRSQKHVAGLVTSMRRARQPIVAAVNGAAYGLGMALACASDIRVAAQSARFCVRFISTGVGGCDIAISYTLPRLIGASRAHDLILTGRVINADQALGYGLVSEVVPDGSLLDAALRLADGIAAYPPFAVAMTKEVLLANLDAQSVESAMLLEDRNQYLTASAAGMGSAITAFAERRWSTIFEADS
jgi:enoyl-CoA hydratase